MTDKILENWQEENKWFEQDDFLRQEAIELDAELDYQGVPAGPNRYDQVADQLREKHPDRFAGYPGRKPRWSDIKNPSERAEAVKAYKHFKKSVGKHLTEEQYIRDYLEG